MQIMAMLLKRLSNQVACFFLLKDTTLRVTVEKKKIFQLTTVFNLLLLFRGVGKQTSFYTKPRASHERVPCEPLPASNEPKVISLQELGGFVDLFILSFLLMPPKASFEESYEAPTICKHCSCPANCSECAALSRRSWAERERAMSLFSKASREARAQAGKCSAVCKRWRAWIKRDRNCKKLWSRLSFRTISVSDSLCDHLLSSFGKNIMNLDLFNQKNVSDDAIRTSLLTCKNLRSLSARRCNKIKGHGFDMEGREDGDFASIVFLTLIACDVSIQKEKK